MKSVFGLERNLAAALSYVFVFFSGIAVLVLERENKFVRFHALQSTLWFGFLFIVNWVLNLLTSIWVIGVFLNFLVAPITTVLAIIGFVSWILLMYKAHKGEDFKLPIVGDVAWVQINKG